MPELLGCSSPIPWQLQAIVGDIVVRMVGMTTTTEDHQGDPLIAVVEAILLGVLLMQKDQGDTVQGPTPHTEALTEVMDDAQVSMPDKSRCFRHSENGRHLGILFLSNFLS